MGTTFGSWLKQRRKEVGVPQDELAERIGCSETMLWKIEAGQRNPSSQIAHLIADYFRIPPDEHEAFVAFARNGEGAVQVSGVSEVSASTARAQVSRTAPWREVYAHKTNLPVSLTPIVGREQEISEASERLLSPKTRLLTMVGPPGIGKTRLSLAVASHLLEYFDDGVIFVDLAPQTQPSLVLPSIARALGLADEGRSGTSIERALLSHLRDKRLLLVLDNFEQVLDAGYQMVDLLVGSPWLKMLVTSREALYVKGERRFPVPPLPLPQLESLPPLHELANYPSLELFVERAQMSEPDFALDRQNAATVAGICVHLDGLPLAIELAAGQAGFLSPQEIADRLTSRLQLLKARDRHLPERQRTLRGAIDSSYNLLAQEEQVLLNRLGVFAGGFTVDAVREVCQGALQEGNVERDVSDIDVEQGLQTLLDKNLITQTQRARDERRLGMLETIREYALEQLYLSGEAARIRMRHANYYNSFAQEAAVLLGGPEQSVQLDRLEGEHNNLGVALQWLLGDEYQLEGEDGPGHIEELERIELGAQLCAALYRFWSFRSYFKEARTWFVKAIERIEALLHAAHPAGERRATGIHPPNDDDIATAQRMSPNLLPHLGTMFSGAGNFAYYQSDFDDAIALHQASLAIRRHLGDKWGISSSLSNLGNVALDTGDYSTSREYCSESLALSFELESHFKVSTGLNNLALVEMDVGNLALARDLFEESLAVAEKMGDKEQMGRVWNNLGILNRYDGNYAEAHRSLERAFALQTELGKEHSNGLTLVNMGFLARDEGAYEEAKRCFLAGLDTVWKAGDSRTAAECFEGLASVAVTAGDAERAALLFGSAEALREVIKAPAVPVELKYYEPYIEQARAMLSDARWGALWAEGRAMSAEEAVSYALQGTLS